MIESCAADLEVRTLRQPFVKLLEKVLKVVTFKFLFKPTLLKKTDIGFEVK